MLSKEKALPLLRQFSDGKLSRSAIMAELGVDYGTLLLMLSEAELAPPRLPKSEEDRLAENFVRIWKAAAT